MPPHDADKPMLIGLASVEGLRSLALGAGGEVETVEGVLCWRSSSGVSLFNGAALLSAAQANADTLRALDRYFRQRGHPYSLLTVDELTPAIAPPLAQLGYREFETLPAMWLDIAALVPPDPERPPPPDLRIAHVENPDDLAGFRDVLRRVFGLPRQEVELVLSDRVLQARHVRHYLGTLGGRPVATASLVLDGEVAGIWNVGTLFELSRRGTGSAMMRYALREAVQLGYAASMLLTSAQGRSLYERLGYRHEATVRAFVPAGDEQW